MKAAGQALPAELQAEMDALLDDLFLSQQLADAEGVSRAVSPACVEAVAVAIQCVEVR